MVKPGLPFYKAGRKATASTPAQIILDLLLKGGFCIIRQSGVYKKMLCHAAEHLIHTFVPPRLIPTPDSVVYNDSIFSRDLQGNHIHTSLVACTNPSSPLTTYQKHLLLHLLFPVLTYSLGSITRFIPICLHKPFILTPLSKAKRRYNIAPFHLGYPKCKKRDV